MSHTANAGFGKLLLAAAALIAAVMSTGAPAAAQGRPVVLDGRVQWIAGKTMMVIPDAGGPSINIDLTQVPQDHYAGVAQGTRVSVAGINDGQRVQATSVNTPPNTSLKR